MSSTGTFTLPSSDGSAGDPGATAFPPYLVLAMDCREPLRAPLRVALGETQEVVIGRGPSRCIQQPDSPGTQPMHITTVDPMMSSRHVRLARQSGATWLLEDLGSKNGTLVRGRTAIRQTLGDGDFFETGNTLWVFREGLGPWATPPEVGAPAPPALARGTGGSSARTADPRAERPGALATACLALERRYGALEKIARSEVSVLIRGETGTGKELCARAIHTLSGRRGPFVPVNCGAIPETLIESELFGVNRGAFSGADGSRGGLVRAAAGGTLFLDEIAELSLSSQVALLRVLQERQVTPVGGVCPVDVDVRFVAATHRDLEQRIAADRFRRDLYGRIHGFALELPPLRERREDIGLLCAALLRRAAGPGADRIRFRRSTARGLFGYRWPCNIRELANVLASAVEVGAGDIVEPGHLPARVRRAGELASPRTAIGLKRPDALREQLRMLLRRHDGNVAAVARALGKQRQQVHRWARQLEIDVNEFRR